LLALANRQDCARLCGRICGQRSLAASGQAAPRGAVHRRSILHTAGWRLVGPVRLLMHSVAR
jgi:hypothetical protein